MPDTPNGDGHAYSFDRRMDRMEAFLESLVDAMGEYHRLTTARHDQIMQEITASHEEVRDLIVLQKEHRYDIMALFATRTPKPEKPNDIQDK
jgi:hypothetical protein